MMKLLKYGKRFFSLCVLTVCVACSQSESTQSTPVAPTVEPKPVALDKNTYKVAVDATFSPFEFQDEKGDIIGFSVDLMTAIGNNQGIKFQFNAVPWEGIFERLDSKEYDLIVASVTITEERKQKMDFSNPYFEATQMIAVKGDNVAIKSIDDLKNKSVSVQTESVSDELLQKIQGANSNKIKRLESLPAALEELAQGNVEATVGDNGVIQFFVDNNYAVTFRTIIDPSFEKEEYGVAVRKNRDDELLSKINTGLQNIQASGVYEQLRQKWFGK
ncbi:MAG: basic amino acid ABC transporter substrate-binding protein [Neisseriaceae bacterium]|nr:basic amino acid ABC transporter substrate-binding protein [Neisseriaceae bacterium]